LLLLFDGRPGEGADVLPITRRRRVPEVCDKLHGAV